MRTLDEELADAVLNNKLHIIRSCVEALRFVGEQYSDIYAIARRAMPGLSVAQWDALMEKARSHEAGEVTL